MARLGEMLRAARQDMGVSLAEVEQATKIRRRYLVALEDEDFAALPETIYVIGFLKTYARYLGLDPDEAAQLFREQSGRRDLPGVQPETRIVREASRKGGLSPAGVSGVLMVAGLVLLLFYGYQQYLRVQEAVLPPPTSAPAAQATAPTGTATAAPFVSPSATPAAPTPTVASGITVELKVSDRCWVRAIVDDGAATPVQGVFLQPGESRTWRGERYVFVRVGNAGAATVTVNGVPQGALGRPGQVVEKEWRSQPAR